MSEFRPAVDVVLRHEGGWVDDPEDLGGETNFGISTLIISREHLSPREVVPSATRVERGWLRAMTEDDARHLYRRLFWDRHRYGEISNQDVATKTFDAAVNMGPFWGHALAQFSANLASKGAICVGDIDGVIGPRTLSALNAADPQVWLRTMCGQMAARYRFLAKARPQNAKFLPGWLKRAAWAGS